MPSMNMLILNFLCITSIFANKSADEPWELDDLMHDAIKEANLEDDQPWDLSAMFRKKYQLPTPAPPGYFDSEKMCNVDEMQAILKGYDKGLCLNRLKQCISKPPAVDFGSENSKDQRDVYDQYDLRGATSGRAATAQRYFILSIGPPASGKGTVLKNLIFPVLKIRSSDPIIDVDVDHYTMKHTDSNEFEPLRRLIRAAQFNDPDTGMERITLRKDTKHVLNQIGGEAFQLYNSARQRGNMEANFPMFEMFTMAEGNPSARKHVIYETTLSSEQSLHWAIRVARQAKRAGLTPVVVYPFTFRHRLYRQAMNRGMESGRLPAPGQVKDMAIKSMRYAFAICRHMRNSQDPDFKFFFLVDNTETAAEAKILRGFKAKMYSNDLIKKKHETSLAAKI